MDSDAPLLGGVRSRGLVYDRRVAYAASCVCCLFSASFTVFSLYTSFFEEALEYTPLQVNYISIAAEIGLYLCVPLLGYVADAYRLSLLGIVACASYMLGYGGCAWVAYTHQSWQWMALFFGVVGVACSASFIASLVNCARLFTNSALFAISVPTTLYGCSSLLFSRVISRYVSDGLAVGRLFLTLGVVLSLVGLLAFYAPIKGQCDARLKLTPDEDSPVAETEESYLLLIKNKTIVVLFLTFVMASGPLEMYQNNIGFLVKSQPDESMDVVAKQVALFTGFSTMIRLVVGAMTDKLGADPFITLIAILGMLSLSDIAFVQAWVPLSVASVASGVGYGASFTLYPLIVSRLCGIERFATCWGLFILGPALGSFLFGILFAANVQQHADYAVTFRVCAVAFFLSACLVARIKSRLRD